jgi:hypothetical protein
MRAIYSKFIGSEAEPDERTIKRINFRHGKRGWELAAVGPK